jgi:3-hydroxybutyryl-CoA dehydratase
MAGLKVKELNIGTNLLELRRQVTQEHINLYASASGDFNPIHIDPEFAKKTQLGGTVAHGMLILAYVSEFMKENFGRYWLKSGSLSARFKGAAYPGDTIIVGGKVSGIEKKEGSILIDCDILCRNQKDEPVIICTTKVEVKNDEDSN